MGRRGNAEFKFQQFTIRQDRCAMKVGTDGILLGSWADGEKARHILEIGTGTGLIALMLAQRFQSQIDTIEIDGDAYQQALENVAQSPWHDRITVHYGAIQEHSTTTVYDLIVSNPPFFMNTTASIDRVRNTARQNDRLTMQDILKVVDQLLSPAGKLALIYPVTQAQQFAEQANAFDFFCHRKLWVSPTPNHFPKRVLMEWGRGQQNMAEDAIAIEMNRHHYTQEYLWLTQDFLLKAIRE
jgi:tRNA1Val (adenine37-N6)-methyltransferase